MDPIQNALSDNIDFSKVKIHVKTPQEKCNACFNKWKNCFMFAVFAILALIIIISLAILNKNISKENSINETLPKEVKNLNDTVYQFGAELKRMNNQIQIYKKQHIDLTTNKNKTSLAIKSIKHEIVKKTDLLNKLNDSINKTKIEVENLKSKNIKYNDDIANKTDTYNVLKEEYLKLGGKEEDIPTKFSNHILSNKNIDEDDDIFSD